MSGIGKFMVPGSRLLKAIAYDRKAHRLRGLKWVHLLSKLALADDPHVVVEPGNYEGLECAWFSPKSRTSDSVILYLHGGGYAECSWRTHRSLISYLSHLSGMRILAINYRLAPEFPFPAAVEDTQRVMNALIKTYGREHVIVGGDSAGGGLALGSMLAMKDAGSELPVKAFALSPWLDLSVPLIDGEGHLNDDPMLDPEAVQVWAKRYLNGQHPHHPWASPVYGNLSGLPPMLIHVGEREMLLDESVRFVTLCREVGVNAHLRIFPQMVHVFQLMHTIIPEARESLKSIAEYLQPVH